VLQKKARKAIDALPDEKLKVVIDFIDYLKSKENIPNELTVETFKKTDAGKQVVKCKDAEDLFNKLGI
jgi:hypothetical protein